MKKLYVRWSSNCSLDPIIEALRGGELLIGTSDTVLGLLADTTQQGFEALNNLKKRAEKPYLILIASKDHVAYFAEGISREAQKLIDGCWPGPLTLILKAKKELPAYMVSADRTIALRVPQHQGLLALLKHFNGLFSTSANLSGHPVPDSVDSLEPILAARAAYIVLDEGKQDSSALPSTIIDCSEPNIRIVREGAYSSVVLQGILGKKLF